jgi:two-component system chemotaxis response regulator CheB
MSPGFVPSLVEWLAPQCPLPVRMAQPGDRLDQPGVFIAPTGQHVVVSRRTVYLSDEPPIDGHRPSVTMLFESVAKSYGPAAIGVLLTGMGRDGAAGLRQLRAAGATTIAQDEASSIVFGMPAAAIELGAADHIVPATQLAPLLEVLTRRDRAG